MIQIPFLIVFFVAVLSFSFQGLVVAQTIEREISPLESPADFPDFIVVPREDLKPFALSTISTSTFGKTAKNISSLEVNQSREKETTRQAFAADISSEDVESNNTKFLPLPLSTRERFYKWIDENGVINVTNDPNAVPRKYFRY
ncbi:MAG: hypothetical protein ACRENF_04405 [Thermodesulfobacteriota bacterium]